MSTPLDHLWQALQALERQQRRPTPLGVVRDGGWYDEWQARFDRVQRVRAALAMSGPTALRIVTERLPGIDLGTVGQILLSACKDVAVVWGGSALVGGAAGAALGALAGGVGALPGALVGAGVGLQAATWVLGVLGLKELVQDLAESVPRALRHYERGVRMAWGPVKTWEMPSRPEQAQDELAEGHIVLLCAILAALAAYLTRGRGDPAARARILQEIRQSPRLGPKVADWVTANEDKLIAHPGLRPKVQQVTMASAPAKDVGPPATPAQLKRLRESGPDGADKPPGDTKAAPVDVAQVGPRVVRATGKVDEGEVVRLTDDIAAGGKSRPAEARAAAELQNIMGGRLDRAPEGSSYDFRFVDGPNEGKRVDFMYTTSHGKQSEIDGMNWHIANNPEKAYLKLNEHLSKAEYVPLDYRNLTPSNQALLDAYIKTLPVAKQSQFILFK
jgi:hypothetical protein